MKSTLLKYKLMRLRSKISFEAFLQTKTIPELIIGQIYKTFSDLIELNEISQPLEYFVVQDDNIIRQLKGKTMTNLFRKLFRMNNELLLIREYIDSQVDKKKAVKYMIQQR